ncbi:hypothetical protein BDW22DRAFT_227625 [Trametopsis cervina]|nr:hypothetical protein BDW22DRAFT_227625 [Trametopsis cervina]
MLPHTIVYALSSCRRRCTQHLRLSYRPCGDFFYSLSLLIAQLIRYLQGRVPLYNTDGGSHTNQCSSIAVHSIS